MEKHLNLDFIKSISNREVFIEKFGDYLIQQRTYNEALDTLIDVYNNSGTNLAIAFISGKEKMFGELDQFVERGALNDTVQIKNVLDYLFISNKNEFMELLRLISEQYLKQKEILVGKEWLSTIDIEKAFTPIADEILAYFKVIEDNPDIAYKIKKSEIPFVIADYFKPKDDFNGVLSTKESALFLYYLNKASLLPSYTKEKVGDVGNILFKLNRKNITDDFSQVSSNPENHKTELQGLKSILDIICDYIESDLKKPVKIKSSPKM